MEEIDIHDFKVVEDLCTRWGDRYRGWTLNENEKNFALFMRVPSQYLVNDSYVQANEEQLFFNEIRIPVSDVAVTLFLKRVGGQEWEKDNNFFERCEEQIKEGISKFPDYFGILNEVTAKRISAEEAEHLCQGVLEIWR